MNLTNEINLIKSSSDVNEAEIDVSEGNFVAYDKQGVLTHVDNAYFQTDYFCPICRECIMRLRHKPQSKELIFVKKPDQIHTLPGCYQAEKKGKIATPHATDFPSLIDKLCHVATPRVDGGNNGGGNTNGGDNGTAITPTQNSNDANQIMEVSFSSLKQLHPYLVKANEANPALVPYVWNYSWITSELVQNFHSGSKIICARLASYSTNRLLLYIFFGDQSLRIDVCFKSKNLFLNIKKKIDKLKEKNDSINENGAYISAKINLLIASNRWVFCSNRDCNRSICNSSKYCNNCCGYYRTIIVQDKQLLAYIAEDNNDL